MKTSTISEGQLLVSCLHPLYEATCTLIEAHNLAFADRFDRTELNSELDQGRLRNDRLKKQSAWSGPPDLGVPFKAR
jgi:hypothetical protein